jgi:hypothetical protein
MDPSSGSRENLRIEAAVQQRSPSPTRSHSNPFSTTLIGAEGTTGVQFLHEHHYDEGSAEAADDVAAKLRKKFKKVFTCFLCSSVHCHRLSIMFGQCGNYKTVRPCILVELLQSLDWTIELWMWRELMDLLKSLSLITLPDDAARQRK